jgi:ferrochelatase
MNGSSPDQASDEYRIGQAMTTRQSSSNEDDHWGVLLLAHGAPDSLADIPAFLLNVRSGRPLPEQALDEIIHRYQLVGGGSPLLNFTRRQADALSARLQEARPTQRVPVFIGMRNWKPFIAEAISRLRSEGVNRVLGICLAPQNSRTSVGLYRQHLEDAVRRSSPGMRVDFVPSWHDQPDLIAAFRDKVLDALRHAEQQSGWNVPVILTAHSVPSRTIAGGDPYEQQVNETARLVAEASGLGRWCVAFQSQGMSSEPWIGPTVESKIDELAAEGCRDVLIAPVGFVCDHVEILYDIDISFRQYGAARGVTVWRSESLNDSPLFITALYSLIASRIRPHA